MSISQISWKWRPRTALSVWSKERGKEGPLLLGRESCRVVSGLYLHHRNVSWACSLVKVQWHKRNHTLVLRNLQSEKLAWTNKWKKCTPKKHMSVKMDVQMLGMTDIIRVLLWKPWIEIGPQEAGNSKKMLKISHNCQTLELSKINTTHFSLRKSAYLFEVPSDLEIPSNTWLCNLFI